VPPLANETPLPGGAAGRAVENLGPQANFPSRFPR
jgi:hypothetical protein